jgi:hypothetical protein
MRHHHLCHLDPDNPANISQSMDFHQADPRPTLETDNSTADTAVTPPETELGNLEDYDPLNGTYPDAFSVPWPGSTFIIRSVSCGKVITLLEGKIMLAPLGGRGSIHWDCVETNGWLGFRNPITNRFLGHDGKRGREGLQCEAKEHQTFENFGVRRRPDGGYIMQMIHYHALWPVGIRAVPEGEILAKIENGGADVIAWEFIRV